MSTNRDHAELSVHAIPGADPSELLEAARLKKTEVAFRPRVPQIIRTLSGDTINAQAVRPSYRNQEYSIYDIELEAGDCVSSLSVYESRHDLIMEAPMFRISDAEDDIPAERHRDLYRSLLGLNHDLAIGSTNLGPSRQLPDGVGPDSESDSIYFVAQVPKDGASTTALSQKLQVYGEALDEVRERVKDMSRRAGVEVEPLVRQVHTLTQLPSTDDVAIDSGSGGPLPIELRLPKT